MLPTVSIVLPTFNGQNYLPQQIDSILSQTQRDFELLIVDDGSTDNTIDIIDGYVRQDRRIRKIPAVGNRGHKRRLMDSINQAKGEFISISDQDDIWEDKKNENLLNNMGGNALIFGRSQLIDEHGNDLKSSILEKLNVDPRTMTPLKMMFEPFVSAHAAMIRREWIDPAAFMGPHPFDWVMGLEAILSDGLTYDDTAVVMHRMHTNNQMNGVIMKETPKKISLYRLRDSTSFVSRDRFYFTQLVDQMSRSAVLSQDVRKVFEDATKACRFGWYHPSKFGIGPARRLKDKLMELFGSFAVSDEDRQQFDMHMRRLTMPQMAPVNLVGALSRYRGKVW